MTPVLAVRDPGAARAMLQEVFGFREESSGRMVLGDQEIAVVPAGQLPQGLFGPPIDHIALSVENADAIFNDLRSRGAQLDTAYTPDGPKDIPEFWDKGVRYVFFEGPEGAPIEFCQKIGDTEPLGPSHFGYRAADLARVEAELVEAGAVLAARHLLGVDPVVEVRFLVHGSTVFELFDEPATPVAKPGFGWVGLI